MRPILWGRVNHKIAHDLSGMLYGQSPMMIKRCKSSSFCVQAGRVVNPTEKVKSVCGQPPTAGQALKVRKRMECSSVFVSAALAFQIKTGCLFVDRGDRQQCRAL